jgi:ADP-heptose:LPS heptosyltransferase
MKQNRAAAELIPGASRRVLIDLTKLGETIRQMRDENLDVLFDFSSWQRLTAFYSMMSGARFTVGFQTAGQYRGRGYDARVEHRSDLHEVDNFRALIASVGISGGSAPKVNIPAISYEPLSEIGDVVVFHLWASGQRSWLREWPEERWIALAKVLARRDTVFVTTGAPSDLDRIGPFVERLRSEGLEAVEFVGRDGFATLVHVLIRARVVVSVNTGVMHLAAVVGAPTVSINGPNRNGRWGPVGSRAIGVEAPGPGCGYLHLGFNFDGNATDCMERITVEMVAEAVDLVCIAGSLPDGLPGERSGEGAGAGMRL